MFPSQILLHAEPQDGDATFHDEISGNDFAGTGTTTIVDVGGIFAANLVSGAVSVALQSAIPFTGNADDAGFVLVVDSLMGADGGNVFHELCAAIDSSVSNDGKYVLSVERNGNTGEVQIIPDNKTANDVELPDPLTPGARRTIVMKFVTRAADAQDYVHVWHSDSASSAATPDFTSPLFNASVSRVIDTLECDSQGTIDVTYFTLMVGTPDITNADCRSLAQNARGTIAAASSDTVPDAFSFTDEIEVPLGGQEFSNTITVAGIDAPTAISISGDSSARYNVNGTGWVSTPGTVNDADQVQLRVDRSTTKGVTASAILNIGGVSDSWDVTTIQPTPPTTAPTLGTITPTTDGASVAFTYSGGDETGYNIRINGGAAQDAGASSPYVVTGLDPDTDYTVEVQAKNDDGEGPWSAVGNFRTDAVPTNTIAFVADRDELVLNTGSPRANLTDLTVDIYSVVDGSHIERVPNHTTDATGLPADITSANIAAATNYRLVFEHSDGSTAVIERQAA